MFRQPLSLQARSLLAAGIALAAFLGLTGVALDAAIYETLRTSLRERLQSYVYAYLATSEVSRSGRWLPPDVGPDSRFDQPNGNLFAGVSRSRRKRRGDRRSLAFAVGASRRIAVRKNSESRRSIIHRTAADAARRGLYVQSGHFMGDQKPQRRPDILRCRRRKFARRTTLGVSAQPVRLSRCARHRDCWRCCCSRCDGACGPCVASQRISRASSTANANGYPAIIRPNCPVSPPTSTISSTVSASIYSVIAIRSPISRTA